MDNKTPAEYDRIAFQFGARYALDHYPVSMSYQYARPQETGSGMVLGHHEWTMFYRSDDDREKHARILLALGGRITGASGGDVSRVR
jgi:hypothetical protein